MAGKPGSLKGVALISGGGANSTVDGALHFVQDPSTGYTEVRGRLTGLAPGIYGFHIHAFGDTNNGWKSTGPHFNPHNKSNGAPVDDERHLGDLGNITANKDGIAEVFINDIQISLSGPDSILGRAVVIHADSDDLGKSVHELCESLGNAGARIGGGIIGIQPTSGAANFFKSLFDMCRASYDMSHKALVLNQETRRRQNEYFRARGIAIPDDGPELEPVAHVNYEMPPIDDSMFYPFVDYGMPPPPPPLQDEDEDDDREDYNDGEGDEDEDEE